MVAISNYTARCHLNVTLHTSPFHKQISTMKSFTKNVKHLEKYEVTLVFLVFVRTVSCG